MADRYDLSGNVGASTNVCSLIEDFNNNQDLQGPAWDAIRGKLSSYQGTFVSFRNVSSSISSIFSNAVKLVTNAIDSYVAGGGTIPISAGLDLSAEYLRVQKVIEELKKTKSQLEADLQNAYATNRTLLMETRLAHANGSGEEIKSDSTKKISTADILSNITATETEIEQNQKYLSLIGELKSIKNQAMMAINYGLEPSMCALENSVNNLGAN